MNPDFRTLFALQPNAATQQQPVAAEQPVTQQPGVAQPTRPPLLGRLTVKIVDAKSKEPVPGATLQFMGETYRANQDGLVNLLDLPTGKKMTMEADNGLFYLAARKEVDVKPGSAQVVIEIRQFEFFANHWWQLIVAAVLLVVSLVGLVLFGPQVVPYLTLAGSLVVGGLWGYNALVYLANSIDAIYRGERGWLEDVWAPPAFAVAVLILLTSLWSGGAVRTWFMQNVTFTTVDALLDTWSTVAGGIFIIIGALTMALIRACTVQRLEQRLDLAPLMASLGSVLSFVIYPVGSVGIMPSGMVIVIAIMFVLTMAIDAWKKPDQAFLGAIAGGVIVLVVPVMTAFGFGVWGYVIVAVLIGLVFILVMFDGVARQRRALNQDTHREVNYPSQVRAGIIHWMLHVAFFGSAFLIPGLLKLGH